MKLPPDVEELCRQPTFWYLATISRDGSPHLTRVWVGIRTSLLLINTALGRAMEQNMRERPEVSLAPVDGENPYSYVEIRGRVVRTVIGAPANRDIDELSLQYLGKVAYPWRRPDEERVTFLIEPTAFRRYDFKPSLS